MVQPKSTGSFRVYSSTDAYRSRRGLFDDPSLVSPSEDTDPAVLSDAQPGGVRNNL